MISGSLVFLVALILTIAIWQSNLRAKEQAFIAAKQLCLSNRVDLLDDTVILHKIKLNKLKIIRHYRFDYHTGSNIRYQGYISMSQNEVIDQRLTITADPLIKSGEPAPAANEPAKVLDFSQYKNLKSKNDT
ncbi:MAG: hypothetical protein K0Q57_295 [Gammaproteobacteria bacterium]|jgi:hypothetical protein|nr:hypothetical protein [Gammaproteobacteria bacterium]